MKRNNHTRRERVVRGLDWRCGSQPDAESLVFSPKSSEDNPIEQLDITSFVRVPDTGHNMRLREEVQVNGLRPAAEQLARALRLPPRPVTQTGISLADLWQITMFPGKYRYAEIEAFNGRGSHPDTANR